MTTAPLTLAEVRADLAATDRDITRLDTIAANLALFIDDSQDENRSHYRMDLLRFRVRLIEARELRTKILAKLAELEAKKP